jgi:hypothetical protein
MDLIQHYCYNCCEITMVRKVLCTGEKRCDNKGHHYLIWLCQCDDCKSIFLVDI